ncbi:MAG: hypothetical protein GY899_07120, partial [Verrucomicrobiaceae bacterium]|nr:hypothetical protein [Verrucomicrobiaceae bacterium]
MKHPFISRRAFLQKALVGFGSLALSDLDGAPVIGNHPPRERNVIFLF